MNEHKISIEEQPYFSTPVVFFAVCSCGKYRSGKNATKEQAIKSGEDHVKAKS